MSWLWQPSGDRAWLPVCHGYGCIGYGVFAVVLGAVLSVLGMMVYNVYFHPLRRYPGPKWWAASRMPWITAATTGRLHRTIEDLHKQYGPVVRIGPKEIAYTTPNAWKQIYGMRPGQPEMVKDFRGAGLMPTFAEHESIITADRTSHSRMRRLVAHAFSEKALREQEEILQGHVDTLFSRLFDKSSQGPQNIVDWFNWTTFDVMGDLTYSQPFGCLKSGGYHEWVASIFQGVKGIPFMQAALYLNIAWLRKYVTPKKLVEAKEESDRNAFDTLDKRIAMGSDARKDIMSYILRNNTDRSMETGEIQQTAIIMMIAGSETTATFLSGALYNILRHPRVYERLVKEVRTAFKSYSEIDSIRTAELKYSAAVVAEAFRHYPPAPNGFPRIVPGQGEEIEGQWVPGDTTVGVHQWAANRDSRNFHRADDFLPERYLDEKYHENGDVASALFAEDQKQVVQPFSFGPRNCIGKNLAYSEIRLIMAKLFWTFDLKLAPQSDNDKWIKTQETFMLWEKPPLQVILIPVRQRHEIKHPLE